MFGIAKHLKDMFLLHNIANRRLRITFDELFVETLQ